MLGTKRAVPLWQSRKPRLALERALAPARTRGLNNAIKPQSIVDALARSRVATEAKRKGRFSEA